MSGINIISEEEKMWIKEDINTKYKMIKTERKHGNKNKYLYRERQEIEEILEKQELKFKKRKSERYVSFE